MAGSWTGTTGVVIAGRYRLRAPIANGAMGEIWRGEDLASGEIFAIKLIDPELVRTLAGTSQQHELLARFQREARTGALLRHPNVVHVHDHGIDEGVPYLVMELLEGETLASRLMRGPISPGETARIVQSVARALERARELGIIHRDLKPENVFLVSSGDEGNVKVLDFGVAKLEAGSAVLDGRPDDGLTLTMRGDMVGTPCYMSPEQIEGRRVDSRADLWSLAVITFECICGKRPFDAPGMGALALKISVDPIPVPSTLAQVPSGFDGWWTKAICRDPAGRFQTARELEWALRAVLIPSESSAGLAPAPVQVGGGTGAASVLEVSVVSRVRGSGKLVVLALTLTGLAGATYAARAMQRGSHEDRAAVDRALAAEPLAASVATAAPAVPNATASVTVRPGSRRGAAPPAAARGRGPEP